MHCLSRQVRFTINPFLAENSEGCNSFSSKPAGEGLGIYFELSVKLSGQVEEATGLVVNVTEIDKMVRQFVVPVFSAAVREDYQNGRHIGFERLAELLREAQSQLTDKFGISKLEELSLKTNPFRKLAINCGDKEMIYFSEKFEFAATHKLWNDDFSEQRNFEVFGKCANPTGHGHNYVIEVTVGSKNSGDLKVGDLETIVEHEFVALVDHRNLNADVEVFGKIIPTVENIAVFAWDKLVDNFAAAKLVCVTIWETEKTSCSYYGGK